MKAIAIIEVPEGGEGKWYIDGEIRYTENESLMKKFDKEMIPLKPLPCKKYMRQMPSNVLEMGKRKRDFIIHRVDVDNAYAMGWNDCIEYLMTGKDADAELNDLLGEILGETE